MDSWYNVKNINAHRSTSKISSLTKLQKYVFTALWSCMSVRVCQHIFGTILVKIFFMLTVRQLPSNIACKFQSNITWNHNSPIKFKVSSPLALRERFQTVPTTKHRDITTKILGNSVLNSMFVYIILVSNEPIRDWVGTALALWERFVLPGRDCYFEVNIFIIYGMRTDKIHSRPCCHNT